MFKRLTAGLLVGALVSLTPADASAAVSSSATDRYPDFDGAVRSIVHRGSTVYVGGEFDAVTDATGRTYVRHGAAAVDVGTGQVLGWNPNVGGGSVHALAVGGDGVYLAGKFTSVGGRSRVNLARVSRGAGRLDPSLNHRFDGPLNAVALSKRKVYVGGAFTAVDGTPRTQLAAVGRGGGSTLRRWAPKAQQGQVTDIVKKREGIFVAGYFHRLNNDPAHQFVALVTKRRGATVRSFKPNVPNLVLDISVTRTRIYAAVGGPGGGAALAVKRRSGERIFHRRFDGDVQAITTMNRRVYAGGHFSAVCVDKQQGRNGDCQTPGFSVRHRGASLDRDGDVRGWNPDLDGSMGVQAFNRYKGKDRLLVGGDFTQVGAGDPPSSTQALRFAVFNAS